MLSRDMQIIVPVMLHSGEGVHRGLIPPDSLSQVSLCSYVPALGRFSRLPRAQHPHCRSRYSSELNSKQLCTRECPLRVA